MMPFAKHMYVFTSLSFALMATKSGAVKNSSPRCFETTQMPIYTVSSKLTVASREKASSQGTVPNMVKDGVIKLLNKDGSIQATYQTMGTAHSTPVTMKDGTVAVASNDAHVYFFNAKGVLMTSFKTASWNGKTPTLSKDGSLNVGTKDNKTYKLSQPNKTTGNEVVVVQITCTDDEEMNIPHE